jgi:hypothetical protein
MHISYKVKCEPQMKTASEYSRCFNRHFSKLRHIRLIFIGMIFILQSLIQGIVNRTSLHQA